MIRIVLLLSVFLFGCVSTQQKDINYRFALCPDKTNVDDKQYFEQCLGEKYPELPNELKRAFKFIRLYYFYDLSDESISQYLDVDKAYTRDLFLNSISITDSQLVDEVRVKKAETILKQCSDFTIERISYRVGYMDEKKLVDAFTYYIGVAPEFYPTNCK
ncbi:helix-turn-helix transcriptional regulator [Vibrio sonorensis]|uniref:helix-turn-helix transcriptional regulator n=1 Tax=Vibrio sonorensis TaxID=1004316 RepID=UPI0008DA77D6|nr:helix-turn-helix transcriptional regulator [Vibrio sonorensis]